MKIYFITSKLNFLKSGGSIEEFDLMMRTLQDLGNEVVCVTTFVEQNDIPHPLPYMMVEEDIPYRGMLHLQYGILRIMKKYEHDADFFHVDGHLFLYGAGLYRRLGGKVPVSAFFNRELAFFPEDRSILLVRKKVPLLKHLKKSLRNRCERTLGMFLARSLDLRAFISPMYQRMYEQAGFTNNGTHFVLGDPIDFSKLMRENEITPDSYLKRINKSGPILLFFSSRMAAGKGFDLILAGFACVKNKAHFRLVLGGSGPEEEKIHQMSKDLGIEQYVEFPGWMERQKLFEFYKRADVFIQVGWRPEGTSISLLYAMAFGLPSIVPAHSGLAWQAGGSALVAVNGDHEGLARQIEKLGNDEALRAELSRQCYVRLSDEQMDHKKVIAKWFGEMEKIKEREKKL
jgi:glycosyltransferase involved in cell wall biosynthesis